MAFLPYGKRMLKTSLEGSGLKTMKRKKRMSPDDEAEVYCKSIVDKDCFVLKYISDYKGYGVFSKVEFGKGDFLLQYCGEKLSANEGSSRLRKSKSENKFFFYTFKGEQLCIDAEESVDRLCQMVNDAPDQQANAVMKLKVYGGKEYLCLFALKEIHPGEEILYNYGDEKNLWWRKKDVAKMDQFEFDSDSDPFELKDDNDMDTSEEEDYVPCSDSVSEEELQSLFPALQRLDSEEVSVQKPSLRSSNDAATKVLVVQI